MAADAAPSLLSMLLPVSAETVQHEQDASFEAPQLCGEAFGLGLFGDRESATT